ncbi:MAG: sulfatase-like hydrolase/transferase [Verrucomicrobiota bacterium]
MPQTPNSRPNIITRICLGLATLLLSLIKSHANDSDARPNILLVLADDLSPENLGIYDGSIATPHLDRLAQEGIYLQNAWATPMCGPTRVMVMTGSGAQRTGIWHNALKVRADGQNPVSFAQNHITLPRAMKDAGYATAIAGKPHLLGGAPNSPKVGFDEYCLHTLSTKKLPAGSHFDGKMETEYTLPGWQNPVTSRYWHPCIVENGKLLDTGDEDFGDEIFADFLLDFIEKSNRENRPAFAYFTMALPHTTAGADDETQAHRVPFPTTPSSGRPGKNYNGTWDEMVRYIDALMGKIRQQLEERSLIDNTIVVFTSDNGDQHTGAKMSATEQGARVPVIISGPREFIKPKGSSSALFSLADLLPTCVSWAAGEVPSTEIIDGISQADYFAYKSPAPRKILDSYCGTARMIRDQNWCLEAVDPLRDHPAGRLYRYNKDGTRTQLKPSEMTEASIIAKQYLERRLSELPYFDPSLPHIESALAAYSNAPHQHQLEFTNELSWYIKK